VVSFVPDSYWAVPDNKGAEAFAAQLERAFTRDHPGRQVANPKLTKHYSWFVGNPYLGITSGLPVIRQL
jgi:hypothetical protein